MTVQKTIGGIPIESLLKTMDERVKQPLKPPGPICLTDEQLLSAIPLVRPPGCDEDAVIHWRLTGVYGGKDPGQGCDEGPQ